MGQLHRKEMWIYMARFYPLWFHQDIKPPRVGICHHNGTHMSHSRAKHHATLVFTNSMKLCRPVRQKNLGWFAHENLLWIDLFLGGTMLRRFFSCWVDFLLKIVMTPFSKTGNDQNTHTHTGKAEWCRSLLASGVKTQGTRYIHTTQPNTTHPATEQ